MTTTEFSQAFDAQISAYNESIDFATSDKGLSFGEYEKSVFLTRAQDELVLAFYSGKNSYNEGFENTEEVRRYLSQLVNTAKIEEDKQEIETLVKVHPNSHFFRLPEDLWFITYEALQLTESDNPCTSRAFIEVQPITQDELHKVLKNPFRGITQRRALRLDISEGRVEIISALDNIANYTVRYVKEPLPIILDDLAEEIDIKGNHNITECELHPALHKTILDRAIQLAIASKAILGGVKQPQ